MHPPGVSDVWQTRGLETRVFGSVAIVGLTGRFSEVWQGRELGVKPEEKLSRQQKHFERVEGWHAGALSD